MRFDPSLPDDTVNVSPEHPVREAATLVAGIVAVAGGLIVVIALTIDLVIPWVPPSFEARLLGGVWSEEEDEAADAGEAPDPRTAGVVALVDRLAVRWPENPYAIRVMVREEPAPNAFALPGGVVVVTTGLVDVVETENELAFVLAHELGHFRNRDHLRGLGRAVAFGLVMAGLGIGGDGAAELATLSAELAARRFDRDQESDADRFALELIEAEYGHVAGSWEFFGRLPEPEGQIERQLVHYLSTHPISEERIAALAALARERGWPSSGSTVPFGAPTPEESR